MNKISLAEAKRFFDKYKGREVTASWCSCRLSKGSKFSLTQTKAETRIIDSVTKSGVVNFKTQRGISELRFGQGDTAFKNTSKIEFRDKDGRVYVSYTYTWCED